MLYQKIAPLALFIAAIAAVGSIANAQNQNPSVFSQAPNAGGMFYQSSSNGTDYDQYVWDDFKLKTAATIAAVDWYGVFDPAKYGSGGVVTDFRVAIYGSIPAGTQPDVSNAALMEFRTGNNAGETMGGQFGTVNRYAYHAVFPNAFKADSGKKYWLQIEAFQSGVPDWSIVAGMGGDSAHFRRISLGGDVSYQSASGDVAFSLSDQSVSGVRTVKDNALFRADGSEQLIMWGATIKMKALKIPQGSSFLMVDLRGKTVLKGSGTGLSITVSQILREFPGPFILRTSK